MDSILITGGAGFIGSAVVKELKEKGEENLFVIDNLSFGKRELIDIPESHFFQIDLRDQQAMRKAIKTINPTKVVHLAAIHFIPYCNEHPFEASDINIRGTINLLDILGELNGLRSFFFASTAAVYPIHDEALSEEVAPLPTDIYGLSKLTGEKLCSEFHLKTGIPTIICRFFNAFGPNETNPHLIPEIQKQLNQGKRAIKLGNMEPKRDFIHTSDMAMAVRLLLEHFDSGIEIFNLGRGIEYSIKEVVEAFEVALGEKLEVKKDPLRVRKSDRMHLLADINKLKSFLNWEPALSIEEGLKTLLKQNISY